MISDVAALYVDPRGPYPRLVEPWYDEVRDARTYSGPWPVVAHPPCGPWGRFAFRCKQDASCAPSAVLAVQRFGGVLEHPAHSALWRHCGLPCPGEGVDAHRGWSIVVNQCDWGHACKKPTWLYLVGVHELGAAPPAGTPTHRVTNNTRGDKSLPRASAAALRRSPPAFAEWLISLAQQVNRKGEVA